MKMGSEKSDPLEQVFLWLCESWLISSWNAHLRVGVMSDQAEIVIIIWAIIGNIICCIAYQVNWIDIDTIAGQAAPEKRSHNQPLSVFILVCDEMRRVNSSYEHSFLAFYNVIQWFCVDRVRTTVNLNILNQFFFS